jgi:DNA-binding beta-propeller fold protein YncE
MKHRVQIMVLAVGLAVAAPAGFKVTKQILIGGAGGWDYLTVDSEARRLYVSHSTRVNVVDLESGKVVGEIPDTSGVHGIAIAPQLGRGFVSNGRSNDATIFDLKTLKTLGHVKTGENPDAILFDPASGRVFTFNGRSKDATVFDAASGKVESTIPLGGKPEFSASDGAGRVYVNIEDTAEVAVIDSRKLAVTKRYSLAPCDEPSGLALDVKDHLLFSVCGNKLMTISDPESGKVVATLPIGQGADGAGFDPTTRTAFSSNGEGTLTVVREVAGKWAVAETVTTARGARTMAVDGKTHAVYTPTAEFGPAPAPTKETPRPRPSIVDGSFKVLVISQ